MSKIKLVCGQWHDYDYDNNNLSELKKFIDSKFGINCLLIPRIKIKRNKKTIDSIIVSAKKKIDMHTQIIPLTIYPIYKTLLFDKDIVNENIINKKISCSKFTEEYLPPNNKIIIELENLITQIRLFVNKQRK